MKNHLPSHLSDSSCITNCLSIIWATYCRQGGKGCWSLSQWSENDRQRNTLDKLPVHCIAHTHIPRGSLPSPNFISIWTAAVGLPDIANSDNMSLLACLYSFFPCDSWVLYRGPFPFAFVSWGKPCPTEKELKSTSRQWGKGVDRKKLVLGLS